MKALHKTYALAVFALILTSCSKDSEVSLETADLTVAVNVSIKDQTPHFSFNNEVRGIYSGVVASGENLSRGKIWINIGNNSQYGAYIEMVDGDIIELERYSESALQDIIPNVYKFVNATSEIVIDLSDFNSPVVESVILNSEPYFGLLVKNMSNSNIIAMTGYFAQDSSSSFDGTWNLIADGSKDNPNQMGGAGITSAMVTFSGVVFIDNVMENFNFECAPNSNFTPILVDYGGNNVYAGDQVSQFNTTTSYWNLQYDTNRYIGQDCGVADYGTFEWVNAQGSVIRTGYIYVD